MNEISIQYQGFSPSEFTRSYLDQKLSDLQAKVPYGASIKAVFIRKNKIFSASIRIMSQAGPFFATANGRKMRHVSRRLSERLGKQLKRWKTVRFQRRALRGLQAAAQAGSSPNVQHDDFVA